MSDQPMQDPQNTNKEFPIGATPSVTTLSELDRLLDSEQISPELYLQIKAGIEAAEARIMQPRIYVEKFPLRDSRNNIDSGFNSLLEL